MKVKDILIRQKKNKKVAITYKKQRIRYSELYREALNHSQRIRMNSSNRNIGIFFHNSINYAVAYFTVAFLDKVIIPIEDNIRGCLLSSMINYCEISLVITDNDNIERLIEMLEDVSFKLDLYNISTGERLVVGKGDYIRQGDEDEEDVVIMLHTSGTTSNPKKVMLTNTNLIANIESNIKSLGITSEDVSLIVLPMFFGYCNSSQFLSHLYIGASIVIYDSVFVPRKFFNMIDTEKCTNTTCVPSMLFLVINNAKREDYDLSTLRYLCFGGGVMPIEKLKKISIFFGQTRIIQTYGQTEASPRVTCLLPVDADRKMGSVGKAIPNVVIDIFDEEDNQVKRGEVGQIVVKGPNVMKGYYKQEEETRRVLKNGWLHTGDLGIIDDEGYLYVVGRIKNIIISGGLNIYPEEIEEVLINHPCISEVMVYGEADEILSEVPVAKVVLKDGIKCAENELKNFVLKKLAPNKVPRRFIYCDGLERTNTGKIKRK